MSAKNVLPTFLFGESRDKLRDWSVRTRDQLREDTRLADWIWRQRSRSLAGRPAVALKAEKPGPVHSVDEIPGRSEVGSSSQPAVHSNQFPGRPLPLLPTHVPGP